MPSVLVALGLLAVAAILILSALRYYRYLLERRSVAIPAVLSGKAGSWILWQAEWLHLLYYVRSGRFPRMRDLLAKYEPHFSLRRTMRVLGDSIAGKGEYRSQIGQDYFLNKWFFRNHKRGVFVDVGAYDGVSGSNTWFFEKVLEWNGLALEPQPQPYEKLVRTRRCKTVNACAYDTAGSVQFRQFVVEDKPSGNPRTAGLPPLLALKSSGVHSGEQLAGIASHFDDAQTTRIDAASEEFQAKSGLFTVRCITLSDLLEENKLWVVDYLTVDVEGAELKVLNGLDLSRFHVNVMSIERSASFPQIRDLLQAAGFEHAGMLFWDDIYVNRSLKFSWA